MKKNSYKILFFVLIIIIFAEATLLIKNYQKPATLQSLKEDCIKNFSNAYQRQQCLSKYFEQYTKLNSPKLAIDEALALKKQGIINQCHIVAHSVGHATLVKNNFDVAKSLAVCPKSCLEGCAHGVVENLMSKVEDSQELLNTLPSICDGLENESQKFQCVHGIGYGLRKHGEVDLKTGVDACKGFSEDVFVNSCLDGAFMEDMNIYLELTEEKLTSKLPTMCKRIEEQFGNKALYYCVRNIAEGLMFYTGGNIEKANSFCNFLSTDYIKQCLISVEHEQFLDTQE